MKIHYSCCLHESIVFSFHSFYGTWSTWFISPPGSISQSFTWRFANCLKSKDSYWKLSNLWKDSNYRKHCLESSPWLSSHLKTCLFQLWNCLKWLSLLYHRQKWGVGGTETFKQNHTGQEHKEEHHPGTDVLWLWILTLGKRNLQLKQKQLKKCKLTCCAKAAKKTKKFKPKHLSIWF